MIKNLLFFIFLSLGIYSFYKYFWNVSLIEPKVIEIKKGETVKQISKKLEEKNVIRSWYAFYIYSFLKGKSLKYGLYEFKNEKSIEDVWKKLYEGKEKLIKVTIIPGEDLLDIAEKLSKNKIVEKDKFLEFVFDRKNVKKFRLKGESFEGYFPPDTYFLRRNSSVEEVTKVFLDQFKKKYLPYSKKFEKKGIPFYKAMIIASLVEKETFIEEEKPVIAGVIFNRLNKVMHLQIDPTVIYAHKLNKSWNGNLNKESMKIDSPYNTYINYGLPPTPICSFSISSLRSVLNYKDTEYLYYVFDGKKHIFSKTYKEHIKNIKKILSR